MTIKVKDLLIDVSLFTNSMFEGLKRYQTDKKAQYKIESKKDIDFDLTKFNKLSNTKFYELFESNDIIVQRQFSESKELLGYIKYDKNSVYIYPLIISFELEYLLSQYALVYFLRLKNDAIFMHGSSIKYKDKGIIFTAKSGTGKSTHVRMWTRLSDAININDDKNIIALEGDELVIYSSPWSGKERRDNNISAPLKCIVFIYQNKENVVRRLKPREALKLLFPQIEAVDERNKDIWNKVVDKMLCLPLYYLGCNMLDEAFYTINERILEDVYK